MAQDNLIDPSGWFDDLDPSNSDDDLIDPTGWFDDEPEPEARSTRQRYADRGMALPGSPLDFTPEVENAPITTQPQMSPAGAPAGPDLFPQSPAGFDQLSPENRQRAADATVGGAPHLFEGDAYGQPTLGETIARGEPGAPERIATDAAAAWGAGSNLLLDIAATGYGLVHGNMDLPEVQAAKAQAASGVDFWEEIKSQDVEARKEVQRAAIGEADGFFDELGTTIMTTVTDPILLLDTFAEQGPMLMTTGMGGRIAGAAAKVAGHSKLMANTARVSGALGTGGAMHGADVGGDTYDQLMSQENRLWAANEAFQKLVDQGVPKDEAKKQVSMELSRWNALAAATISVGLNMAIPGAKSLERVLGGAMKTGKGGLKGAAISGARGGLGEAFQEGGEEGTGRWLSNLATQQVNPEQELGEGTGEATGFGSIFGILGGISGAIEGSQARPSEPPAQEHPVSGLDPLGRAAPSLAISLTSPNFNQQLDAVAQDMANVSPAAAAGFQAASVEVGDLTQGAEPIFEDARTEAERQRVFDEQRQQEASQRDQETERAWQQREEQEQLQREEDAARARGERVPNRALGEAFQEARESREERWTPQGRGNVSLDEEIGRLEQEVARTEGAAPDLVEVEDPTPIMRSDGQPYRTQGAARRRMNKDGIEGEVIETDGGFAILPGGERRQDAETRRRIEEIPEEDLTRDEAVELAQRYRQEARTDELSGVQNVKAYNEAEQSAPAPVKVAIDVDSLGYVNDNIGHEAGDDYIREVGRVLSESGLQVYRVGGDEFVIRGEPGVEVDAEAVREELARSRLEFELPNGETVIVDGVQVSMGAGATRSEADAKLYEDKARRTQDGQRPRQKGDRPPNISVRAPENEAGRTAEGQPAEADRAAGRQPAEAQGRQQEVAPQEARGQSRREQQPELEPTGNTTQGVRSRIPRWMVPMLESGLVEIVQSTTDVPTNLPPDIAGVWLGDKIYLIADNIDPYNEVGLVLHEVGVHHGLKDLIGQERYDQLVRQVRRQVGRGNTEDASASDRQIFEAYQRALADPSITTEEDLFEETIAYLAEAGADASVFQRIVAAIRDGLRRVGLGILAENISAADIAHLARGSTRKTAREEKTKNRQARSAQPAPARASRRKQTETPEFKRWFGDSKVVDENGDPLVVYHGTAYEFTEFKTEGGAWFTPDFDIATFFADMALEWRGDTEPDFEFDEMGGDVISAHLSIQNPKVMPFEEARRLLEGQDSEAAIKAWKDAGHDGLILEGDTAEGGESGRVFLAFSPEQIKSATGNTGAFDPTNPDIRYSRRQVTTPQFKRWFGDSKVTDAKGDPLRVYHGTDSNITEFLDDKRGSSTRAPSSYKGFFFTSSPDVADGFARLALRRNFPEQRNPDAAMNLMPTYLRIENPLEHQWERGDSVDSVVSRAQEQGHDGVILRQATDGANPWSVYVDGVEMKYIDDRGGVVGEVMPMLLDGEITAEEAALEVQKMADYMRDEMGQLDASEQEELRQHDLVADALREDPARVTMPNPNESDVYVAFRPNQIKSATGNTGEFSPFNPDIRYSRRKGTPAEYREAVKSGDMVAAQRMVNEAAHSAGYTEHGLHGTAEQFWAFDLKRLGRLTGADSADLGFFFSSSEDMVEEYAQWSQSATANIVQVKTAVENLSPEELRDLFMKTWLARNGDDYITDRETMIDMIVDEAYQEIGEHPDDQTGFLQAIAEATPDAVNQRRVVSAFLRMENPKVQEYGDVFYDSMVTEIIGQAKAEGHDGVILKDIDGGDYKVVFSANQIKSADPVTRDDNGNIIPLSERFTPQTDDMRYSRRQAGTIPVSTRIPSEPQARKNPALDALENLLSIDSKVLKEAADALRKNVNLLYKTVPVQPLSGQGSRTVGVRLEHVLDFERDNLEFLHDLMPEQWRSRAKLWYDGARRTAEVWADRYGVTESQAGGIIAVLSPQKGWFENMSMTERILDITSTQQDHTWDAAMDEAAARIPEGQPELLELTRGRRLSEVMNEPQLAARWIRIYDQAHNSPSFRVLTPEGGVADWVRTGKGNPANIRWASYSAVAKAVALINDGSAENLHYQLGTEHKVRSFYNNIVDPNSDRGTVTIDTHAVAAATLLPLSIQSAQVAHAFGTTPAKETRIAGASSSAQTGMRGTYPVHKEAYERAARAKGILPREMQSITWEAIRGLFPDTMKRSAKKRQQIHDIWERHRTGEISQDQAQQELQEAAGNITPPAWVDVPYNDTPSRTYEGDAQAAMDERPTRSAGARTGLEAPAVSFEVAPDPNNAELTERWNSLDEQIKLAISERVAAEIVPGALAELGLEGQVQMDLGGYLGATNPSLSVEVSRPGSTIRLAKLLGHALSQDSMMAVGDQPFLGGQKTGAVSIILPDGYSAQQVEEIYDRLWEIEVNGERVVSGHTTRNGIMAILNFGDTVSTTRLEKLVYNQLNGEFVVESSDVHAAFVDNTEYGYGEEESATADREAGAVARRSPVQRRASDLRRNAQAALKRELDAARPRKFSRRTPGRPGAAANDERARAQDPGAYGVAAAGQPGRRGRVDATGVHFSREPRTSLDGRYYGTGLSGDERPRVMAATDQRLKERVYTYINQGTGIRPERGVGTVPHRVPLQNLYDLSADPLGFRTTHAGDMNAVESEILDQGFSGYLVRDSLDGMSTSVVMGQASHAVTAEPIESYDDAPVVPEQAREPADEIYDEIKNLSYAPTGQVDGNRWRELLQDNSPDLAADLDRMGVLAKLGDKTYYYPDQVAALARDAVRGTQPRHSRRQTKVIDAAERFAERGNSQRGRRRLDKLGMIWRWDIITQDMTRATVYDDPAGRPEGSLQEVWFDSMDRLIPAWIEQEREARDETYDEIVERFRSEVQQEVGQDVSVDDLARYAMGFSGERAQFLDEVMASDLPANVKRQAQSVIDASLPANDIRYSRRQQPKFYSAVERAVEGIQQNKAQPQQWLAMIRKQPGVKKEELDWLGLEQWLADRQGTVTRDEVLDFVRQNMVQVEESTLSPNARAFRSEDDIDIASALPDEFRIVQEEEGFYIEVAESEDGEGFYPVFHDDGMVYAARDMIGERSDEVYQAARRIEQAFENPEANQEYSSRTKYEEFQTPGGQNYQELLLTLPTPRRTPLETARSMFNDDLGSIYDLSSEQQRELQKELDRQRGQVYRSPHFEQPNILAHVRFNERTDADGKRVLFIEEIQSDWHQEGRKRGYQRFRVDDVRFDPEKKVDPYTAYVDGEPAGFGETREEAIADITGPLSDREGVPDAPFKQSWPMLAMKRMIRYAAENNFDRIAWTPGDVQADRYDLSRQVEQIEVSPGRKSGERVVSITMLPNDMADIADEPLDITVNSDGIVTNGGGHFDAGRGLDEVLGKEMAEKIMAGEGEPSLEGEPGQWETDTGHRLFRGPDLKIGGEGMRNFYDRILKNEVGKYVKKFGARVGTTSIQSADPLSASVAEDLIEADDDFGILEYTTTDGEMFEDRDDAIRHQMEIGGDATNLDVWAVDVTPKMRESAMEGQPMFSRRRLSTRDRAGDSQPTQVSFDVSFESSTPADGGGVGGVRSQPTVPEPPPAGKEGFSHWAYMGKDSNGQAILIGTAHPSLREQGALQSFWRRWLTKEGQLTPEAFARHIEADGLKNAEEVMTQFLAHPFARDARKAYGKLRFSSIPADEIRKMNDYLAGEEVEGLAPEVMDRLDEMRGHLDQLSTQLQKMLIDEMRYASEALTPEQRQVFLDNLVDAANGNPEAMDAIESLPRLGSYMAGKLKTLQTIEGNKGSYLHRSYRVFDDPKWKPSPEVLERARAFLREQVDNDPEMANATDAQKDNRVNGIIGSILGTDAGGMVGFLSSSQLGEKDRSVLKKRKDIAEEIRDLMGEYHDPRTNFATSATKMAYMLANHHFLKKVREDGLGTFLSKGKEGIMNNEISSWGDPEAMAPLAGLWATKEFAEALRQHVETNTPDGWVKQLYRVNAAVKYGKTVLSPTTAMRNLISASMFTVMNGHFGYHQALHAASVTFADLATSRRAKMEYLHRLVKLGVLHDNPRAREMMDAMQDVADMDTTKGGATARTAKSILNAATRFYRFGDDFWKVIGFESEKARLKRAGMSDAEAETMAADRIRSGYPTYSMVPEGIRMLRRFPAVGTFVSFPWEMIRTTSHQFRFLKEDAAAGRTTMVASRATGMLVAAALGDVLRKASMALMGIGEDEDEAVRELAAPWQKNARLMYLPPDEEGRVRYLDLTHLDPYSYLKLPIYAIANGNNRGADDKAVEAMKEFMLPFLGTDITFGAVVELWANSRLDSGIPVYDRHSTRFEQGKQVFEHMGKNLAPGVFNNIHRTIMAANDRVASYGKPYSLTDEGLAWAGFRLTTADTQTSLKFRGFDFGDHKNAASRPTYRALRSFNPQSEADIRQAVRVTHNVWTEAFDGMHNAVTAARVSGLSDREIESTLDGAGVAKKHIGQLMDLKTPPWRPSQQSINNAYETVTQGRVSISKQDFDRRVKIIKDELDRVRREQQENR